MRKSGLKTGMIVELAGGIKALVVKDNCYGKDVLIFNNEYWVELEDYDEDTLRWKTAEGEERSDFVKSIDIVKVFQPSKPGGFLSRGDEFSDMKLLWQRLKN